VDYRYFGRTGLKVSEISLGTQTFGWTTEQPEAHSMLDYYVEQGGNYLDTADSYNEGRSEEILGAWLKKRKRNDDVLVGTKSYFSSLASENSNKMGLSKKHLVAAVDASLSRLGLEAIDLFQLHCCDGGTGIEEVADTMEDFIRRGKVLHYGLSNFLPSAIMRMVDLARFKAFHHPASLQLEYSLLVRSPEWELLPLCAAEDIGTLAWSPLAGGWLTGKYKRDRAAPENSRGGRRDRWDDQEEQRGGERTWAVLDCLEGIATSRGVFMSQVALNWMRRKSDVSSILIGARTMEQLQQNLGCLDWELAEEDEKALDRASELPKPYPYSFVSRYSRAAYR
jgi:aryl-alcohol dehydrogenase-like predicted oxidoreductase